MHSRNLYFLAGGLLALGTLQSVQAQSLAKITHERNGSHSASDSGGSRGHAASSRIEREVFDLINRERATRGIPTLVWSDRIASMARLHSRNMANQKFFSHRGRDGRTADERARAAGIQNWNAIAENIALLNGFSNPSEAVIKAWFGSTVHRRNLLGAHWNNSAVGVAVANDGTCYFTFVFVSSEDRKT